MASFRLVSLIRRLHLAVRAEVLEHVHGAGYHDITAAHIYVFQTPGPDGLRPTELAERTLMTKQAMNHLLAGLEAGGYIQRVSVDGDRRARVLRITSKGRNLTDIIQERSAAIERRWSERLGEQHLQALMADLGELAGGEA
jgi:DNA-binding MarR family transcriptional regulator